jgi:hypothetical protein
LRDDGETLRSVVSESRPPRNFPNYIEFMSSVIDVEPSSFEEAVDKHVWHDAIIEDYTSIMRNDFWNIVQRPERKSIVSSRWFYKIKHTTYGSIDKFKARFVERGLS